MICMCLRIAGDRTARAKPNWLYGFWRGGHALYAGIGGWGPAAGKRCIQQSMVKISCLVVIVLLLRTTMKADRQSMMPYLYLFIIVILVEPCSYRPAGIWTCLVLGYSGKLVWTHCSASSRLHSGPSTKPAISRQEDPEVELFLAAVGPPGATCATCATPGQENPIDLFQGITQKPCTSHENNSKTQQDMAKKTIVCLTACKNCSSRATHCFFNP